MRATRAKRANHPSAACWIIEFTFGPDLPLASG